jgi:hypothetical protein
MNNLRAFYAKIAETKNQIKLDFTFDSIDLIGEEIEQTFHFSKSNKDPRKQSKIYGLFIGQCLVEELNAEWMVKDDIYQSLININNSIYINPFEIAYNFIVDNDKALNLSYLKESLLDLLNIEESEA